MPFQPGEKWNGNRNGRPPLAEELKSITPLTTNEMRRRFRRILEMSDHEREEYGKSDIPGLERCLLNKINFALAKSLEGDMSHLEYITKTAKEEEKVDPSLGSFPGGSMEEFKQFMLNQIESRKVTALLLEEMKRKEEQQTVNVDPTPK
jgi:hypothetical protein